MNGKVVKTQFDKMPSPSSFGGGIALKLNLAVDDMPKPIHINKSDYERLPRKEKPFADFRVPELSHMNTPETKEYLK